MTAIVKVRLSGDADAISALQAILTATGLEIRFGDRTYPNRGGFGIRAYGEIAIVIRSEPPG
ncbi:hypothetical protein [Nocardia xishanensis]|uniref:hypothetical protein n=1 Tax=Nocardia xishanensis TaxID=238964 RepID=UPI0034455D52